MDEIKLNCRLKGEVAEKFVEIKKQKGLTNSTEAIRLIITEYHSRMVKVNAVPSAC